MGKSLSSRAVSVFIELVYITYSLNSSSTSRRRIIMNFLWIYIFFFCTSGSSRFRCAGAICYKCLVAQATTIQFECLQALLCYGVYWYIWPHHSGIRSFRGIRKSKRSIVEKKSNETICRYIAEECK